MTDIKINSDNSAELNISRYPTSSPQPTQVWNRPASWLPMPSVTGSEEIFSALYPVTNTTYNSVSFTAYGNYIVDWGDGSIENYSSGVTATHTYTYSSIPQSTITPFGYRQALIKITPQAGSSLTQMADITSTDILDIVASGPNLIIGNITGCNRLCHIKWLAKITGKLNANKSLAAIELDYNTFSQATQFNYTFEGNYSLMYVSNFNTFSVTDFGGIFNGCYSLSRCPEINFNNATSLANAFGVCYSLVYVPKITLANPCALSNAFSQCQCLEYIDITGVATISFSLIMSGCNSLFEVPAIDMSNVPSLGTSSPFPSKVRRVRAYGMKNTFQFSTTINSVTLGRTELVELFTNLGTANSGATLNIKGCIGVNDLTDNDKLIATNKGWTLILT